MKSNYTTTHPLMKMSGSPEMMSSRPQHETSKPEAVASTGTATQKGTPGSKFLKK